MISNRVGVVTKKEEPGREEKKLTRATDISTNNVDILMSRMANAEEKGAARMIAMQTGRAMTPMMGTTIRLASSEIADTRLK